MGAPSLTTVTEEQIDFSRKDIQNIDISKGRKLSFEGDLGSRSSYTARDKSRLGLATFWILLWRLPKLHSNLINRVGSTFSISPSKWIKRQSHRDLNCLYGQNSSLNEEILETLHLLWSGLLVYKMTNHQSWDYLSPVIPVDSGLGNWYIRDPFISKGMKLVTSTSPPFSSSEKKISSPSPGVT